MFLKICSAILGINVQLQHGTFCDLEVLKKDFAYKFGFLKIINWERKVVEWIGRDQFPLQMEFGFQFDTKNGDSIFGKKEMGGDWNNIYYFMWPFYYRAYYFMWHLIAFLYNQ